MADELKCKFCEQPIYITEQTAGAYGRLIHMRGKYRHVKDDAWACVEAQINPNNPHYELPKCLICGMTRTVDKKHSQYCSASGPPPYHALPQRE